MFKIERNCEAKLLFHYKILIFEFSPKKHWLFKWHHSLILLFAEVACSFSINLFLRKPFDTNLILRFQRNWWKKPAFVKRLQQYANKYQSDWCKIICFFFHWILNKRNRKPISWDRKTLKYLSTKCKASWNFGVHMRVIKVTKLTMKLTTVSAHKHFNNFLWLC